MHSSALAGEASRPDGENQIHRAMKKERKETRVSIVPAILTLHHLHIFPPSLKRIKNLPHLLSSTSIKISKTPFHQINPSDMDLYDIARKLNLSDSNKLVRKAAELRRLSDVRFDSSIIGVGEVCKAIICLEIAASRLDVIFDRQNAIKLSGMSEKAYNRSFNAMQNGLGVKTKLDIRELGIQFGCVRLIPLVQKGLNLFKDRFLASLPPSRRASADFTRPVFTAVAFYLCVKKEKLKVDKLKLIEVCGTSEAEFSSVSTTMKDLCHHVFGVEKEKKDPREVKGNRELLDMLPGKRRLEDGGYVSDDGVESSCYKKRKRAEKHAYGEWKTNVLASNNQDNAKVLGKRTKQTRLDFRKEGPENQQLEVM